MIRYIISGILFLASLYAHSENNHFRISEHWIQQPVTHNNIDDSRDIKPSTVAPSQPIQKVFFQQQYFVLTPSNLSDDYSVFFVLGNETDATRDSLEKLYRVYGQPDDMVFILAEHRGYGQSITETDQNIPKYVTADNAASDYQRLILHLKETYAVPWIGVGYSYGGALVIHFAHKYPDTLDVILSSSAPISWPFLIPEYSTQAKLNLGSNLANRIAQHLRVISSKSEGRENRELLTAIVAGLSQLREQQSSLAYINVLSYLPTPVFIWVLKAILPKTAFEWSQARTLQELPYEKAITGKYNWYTWKFQQCNELGTFFGQPLFGYSQEEHEADCKRTFGYRPEYFQGSPWKVSSMLAELQRPIVVVSGGKDPWMQLGVKPNHHFRNINFIYDADGYHCPDRDDSQLAKQVLDRLKQLALLK